MHKLIIIAVILILPILIGGGLFLISRGSNNENLSDQKLSLGNLSEKILGAQKVSVKPETVVENSKTSLQKKVQNQANNLNSFIETQADHLISSVLGKKDTEINSSQSTDLLLDLKNDKGKQINLKKGIKYDIKIANITDGFCVFVDEVNYPLSTDSKITVQLTDSGKHNIKLDFCQPTDKNFGELLVE